jgi:transketolase
VPYQLPEGYHPKIGQGVTLVAGADITIIAYGPVLLSAAVAASRILSQEKKLSVKVINLPWLNRVDNEWLKKELKGCRKLLSLDNHYDTGGQGDLIAKALAQAGIEIEFHNLGIAQIPPCGTNPEVLNAVGLDTTAIVRALAN